MSFMGLRAPALHTGFVRQPALLTRRAERSDGLCNNDPHRSSLNALSNDKQATSASRRNGRHPCRARRRGP